MPGAKAFRATRYTPKAGPIEDLVAPPYDVVTAEERATFAAKSPYNIVHLILPDGDADPSVPGNRYERAKELIGEWLASGALAADEEPSVTVVREVFEAGGRERTRTGVKIALHLDGYGGGSVYPHERTLDGPKADRLALMRATKANLGPVFALVPDEDGELRAAISECSAREPDVAVSGPDEAGRRVWIEKRPSRLARIERALEGRQAVIADGHHRYETALTYRDEVVASGEHPGEAEYVLCHVVPVEDPGLIVLPTHRVVRPRARTASQAVLETLGERFDLEEITRERAIAFSLGADDADGRQAFVIASGTPARLHLATLRDGTEMARRAPDRAEAWRKLDVPCLHLLVMEDALGVTPEDVTSGGLVSYSHDPSSVFAAVEGEGVFGFILRPTAPDAVLEVARAGEKMPQKSTYFYPKVAAGFAVRLLG